MESEGEGNIDAAAQHRALAHPVRHRLLISLGAAPATISQLARASDLRKGSVAHHLNVLADAGLVRVDSERQVRGGTERYYTLVHRKFDNDDRASAAALLTALGTEITLAADDDPLLNVRYLRLTTAQAADLRATLDRLVIELEPAAENEPRYGVMVGLFCRGDVTS